MLGTSIHGEIPLTEAQRELVEKNLNVAGALSKRFRGTADARSEACLALCYAARKFDESKSKMSTYAKRWIRAFHIIWLRKEMLRGLGVDVGRYDIGRNVRFQALPKSGVPKEDVRFLHAEDRLDITRAMSSLTAAERRVLEAVYGIGSGDGLNYSRAARKLGVTREAVRQRCRRIITKIKELMQ